MDEDLLMRMAHSPVRNYVVPGLTSWLIGQPSSTGLVRLFVCERDQQESITPHSHRFDFECLVLSGEVRNRVWERVADGGDVYFVGTQKRGRMGGYEYDFTGARERMKYRDTLHRAGAWYGMESHEVHSIFFSRGSKVLFFEGPQKTDVTTVLAPAFAVDGCWQMADTLRVEPWMFLKSHKPA